MPPAPPLSGDPIAWWRSSGTGFLDRLFRSAGLLVLVSLAHAAPITLHLKNGDRITGEIVDESGQRIVLKSPLLGRIALSANEVVRREAVPVSPPKVAAPAVASSKPAAVPPKQTPNVLAGVTNGTPTKTGVSAGWLTAWAHPLLTNWHGTVQLGMDLGFGTADRQTFYANASLNHSVDRFRNSLNLRSAYGIAEAPVSASAPDGSVQTANSFEGLFKTDFDLGQRRKVYLYHQIGAGFDVIRRHNFRFEDGAGLGYKLIERPRWSLNTEGGGQFQHFTYKNGPRLLPYRENEDIVSVRLGENIAWKASDKLTLKQRLQITPNVGDFGDFRARFELGVTYPLLKWVTVNFNVFDEYESRPAGLVENNQLQVQATVGLTF